MLSYPSRIVFLLLLFLPLSALSVDASRLWLPVKYQKHYMELMKAAKVAESIKRCTVVLEGTIDVGESKDGHPIFRVLCRQKSGKSYNEMIDGIAFESLTTPPQPDGPTPEQIEMEKRRLAGVKKKLWEMCETDFPNHVKLMKGLQILTQGQPEPVIFNETEVESETSEEVQIHSDAEYCIDFDARGLYNELLKYRAVCQASSEHGPKIKIRVRKEPN